MAFEAPGKPVRLKGLIEIVFIEKEGRTQTRVHSAKVKSTSEKDHGDLDRDTGLPYDGGPDDLGCFLHHQVEEREADWQELEDLLTEEDWAAVDRIVETIRTEARRKMIPEE